VAIEAQVLFKMVQH